MSVFGAAVSGAAGAFVFGAISAFVSGAGGATGATVFAAARASGASGADASGPYLSDAAFAPFSGLADLLSAAGGAAALSFIVAIALCILALATLFAGSAVVVLERFARSARRPAGLQWVNLCWSLLIGALALDREFVESLGVEWPGALRAFGAFAAGALLLSLPAQGLVLLMLRFVPARRLAWAGAALPGAAYGLSAGGLGGAAYILLPALTAALTWLIFFVRRRRAGADAPGMDEQLAGVLTSTLIACALLTAFAPFPEGFLPSLGILLAAVFAFVVLPGFLPLAAAGFLSSRGGAEWFIARRYLFARRRQTFISLITGICIAGVATGVWLIIVVLSVMNGFERTWRDEIIGNRAHLNVFGVRGAMADYPTLIETIEGVPEVTAASPYLDVDGMLRGSGGTVLGVRLRGIDPERAVRVTDLKNDLMPGSEGALQQLEPDAAGVPGIVIGSRLAKDSGAQVGDTLTLISPFGGPPTPLGPAPRLHRFRLVGTFQSSFFQYDKIFTYTSLAGAQGFLRVGDVVNGIEVRTTDYYRSRRTAMLLEQELGADYYALDWKELFPTFFQALKTERVMMFVLLTMIMVVAAFAIVVTLMMMIMEKSSDIAILKAMGASDASVERIFAIEGVLIGLCGTLAGVVSGVAVTTRLDWVQRQIENLTGVDTLPASIYQFAQLPWHISTSQLVLVSAIAMVLALGATLLPSRHGAGIAPAEALRYE